MASGQVANTNFSEMCSCERWKESDNSRADFKKINCFYFSLLNVDSSCARFHVERGYFCLSAFLADGAHAASASHSSKGVILPLNVGTHSACAPAFFSSFPDWNLTSFKATGNIFGSFVWQQQPRRFAFSKVHFSVCTRVAEDVRNAKEGDRKWMKKEVEVGN